MPGHQNDCPLYEQLVDFKNQKLDVSSVGWISQHLDSCQNCQNVISSFTHSDFGTVTLNPPPLSLLQAPERVTTSNHQAQTVVEGVPGWVDSKTTTRDFDGSSSIDEQNPHPTFLQSSGIEYLGRYRILGKFKTGGMGIVYQVQDPLMNKVVALKMMKESATTPRHLDFFRKEIASLGRLKHENVVPILHCDQIEGKPFFTMELARQGSLLNHLHRFRKNIRATIHLMARVARAMQYVHEKGTIHRDLKPANILLDDRDKPLVSDFGLAIPDESDPERSHHQGVGTLPYMAPEQFQESQELSAQADIWALGVILYEVLTGEKPFLGNNKETYREQICHHEPIKPRNIEPTLPRHVELIILKCLEKDQTRRYSSAGELADDLEGWLEGKAPRGHQHPLFVRVGRWIGHNRLTAICIFSLLLLAIAGPIVSHYKDPDRPLQLIKAKLIQGNPVPLMKGDQYQWFRWAVGPQKLNIKDGHVSFESPRTSVLEIVPPEILDNGSRLSCEIRVDHETDQRVQVGLACCIMAHPTPDGIVYSYASVGFDEIFDYVANQLRNGVPPEKLHGNPILFQTHLFREPDALKSVGQNDSYVDFNSRFETPLYFKIAAKENNEYPWHRLAIHNRQDTITIQFDDQTKVLRKENLNNQIASNLDSRKLNISYNKEQLSTGGIGLMCKMGKATFRNLKLEMIK